MKAFINRHLRASRCWTDQFVIGSGLSVVLTFAGVFLSLLFVLGFRFSDWAAFLTGNAGAAGFLQLYAVDFGVWIIILLAFLVFPRNWPMFTCLTYRRRGNSFRSALIGFGLGFGMNGICVLFSALLKDIKLSFYEFRPGIFFAFLLVVFIQSGAEELVDRCYLYQKLRRRYRHPAMAVFINSLVFTLLHKGNDGVTVLGLIQIFAVGLFLSLIVYYYDSLWAAMMFHTAWNFTQSIVFGLPNSGIVSEYSVFKLEAASARNGIFYNTGFGIEGSVGAACILVLACAVIFLMNRGKGERRDIWAEQEEKFRRKKEEKRRRSQASGM